jgi:hypothetical protein
VAAVDEDRELHGARTPYVVQRVEGGADGAAGEEHVVDEDDQPAVDAVTGDLGAGQRTRRVHAQVVAVHGDVEGADRDRAAGDLRELVGQPAGQEDTPGGNAEEHHVVGALGAFDDLVGDAGQHPRDVGALENGPRIGLVLLLVLLGVHTKRTSFSASRDGSLKDVGIAPPTVPARQRA